ncbi:MAG: hypothetical protein K2X11_16810 [Acetobacteraceae bacterium]|nr:hypothetical protein [Acetobacteraceae bacterium]
MTAPPAGDEAWRHDVLRRAAGLAQRFGQRDSVHAALLSAPLLAPSARDLILPGATPGWLCPGLSLGPGMAMQRVLGRGWSEIEDWGVWMEGGLAHLRLPFWAQTRGAVRVSLAIRAFLPEAGHQEVELLFAGACAARASFDSENEVKHMSLDVDPHHAGLVVDLEIRTAWPTSPRERGLSSDDRRLSAGLCRIDLACPGNP